MRLSLLPVAALLALGAVSCSTDEVRGNIEGARSSAASVATGTKQACTSSRTTLASLGDQAQQLADNPDLRTRLAPQIRQNVDKLVGQLASRPEFGGMVAAARDLATATGNANEAQVEVAARQAVVAVKTAQGVCDLAT